MYKMKNIQPKVVLVEDSKIIARDLQSHLKDFGYTVVDVFSRGEDFLLKERELQYDFVIMDIILEGKLNGVQIVQKLFQYKEVPVLFLTATIDEDIINEAKQLNPLGYLLKPYTPIQLRITFEMALKKWEIDKELKNHKEHLEEIVKERTKELKKAKEEAVQSEKLKTAFIHNMSHEIRTPLNAIIGFTELLVNPKISEHKKNDFVKFIQNSTESLLTLVDNIWQLSNVQIGQIKPVYGKTYLNEMLANLYTEVKKDIFKQNKNIEFILDKEIEDDIFCIYTDPNILRRILQNLLSNAVKYTHSGKIILKYKIHNNILIVSVSDTGIGIEKENLKNIFNIFYKIDSSRQKLFRGAGLGLSLSKSLVELLSGEINVESKVGEGSTFTIKIPIEKEINAKTKIAFIDLPDFNIVEVNKKISAGYFNNIDEFIKNINSGASFELIFINISSVEIGKQELKKLKYLPNIKLILCGIPLIEDWFAQLKKEEKIQDYLLKPVDTKSLMNMVFSLTLK